MSEDLLATVLILASAVVHAIVSTFIKTGEDKYARRCAMLIVVGVIALPAVFFVPFPTADIWALLLLSKTIHLVYEYCQMNAYKYGDLSLVYPVFRGSAPVITAIGAYIVLAEPLSGLQIAALIVICFGIFSFAGVRPVSAMAAASNKKALLFAFATAVPIALYTLIDAIGMRAVPNPFTYMAWTFVLGGIFWPATLAVRQPGRLIRHFRDHLPVVTLAGVLIIVTYGLALLALRLGQTAEIAALRETSVVFAALIGAVFLGEPFGRRRLLAACAIAAGAVGLKVL